MAKKKDDGFIFLLRGALIALFSVFFINTAIVNRHFSKKYNIKEAEIQVTDAGNIIRYFILIPTIVFLGFPIVMLSIDILQDIKTAPIISIIFVTAPLALLIFACLVLSARIGTTQIGMLIFPDKDIFVIPTDPGKNTFTENILLGKLVTNLFSMEELPLSGLKKITRQSGKKAFLHGTFGTRCVSWRNKQKRDECIAALEEARGKRLSSRDNE